MSRMLHLLVLAAALAPCLAVDVEVAGISHMSGPARLEPNEGRPQAKRSSRRELLRWKPVVEDATPGETYEPIGGEGEWENGGSTGIIMIHANVMAGGEVVGWSSRFMGLQEYGSAVYKPWEKGFEQVLDECGLHDCKNSFCGGQTLTAYNDVLIFGGHAQDINWFRSYSHNNATLWSTTMTSGRWYPGVATLPDGKVLVVGGVAQSGKAGYHITDREVDNPTYEVFDPARRKFTGDKYDMVDQLSAAFPIHTYPHVHVLPDGGVAVSAGKLLVKYRRTGDEDFEKEYDYPSRPGAPWSYPQTGQGTLLPLLPPYDKAYFLAAGGTSEDYAKRDTPASNKAQIIELTAGPDAEWTDVGPMPHKRVMGDAIILCDGTVGFFGGAARGLAGWSKEEQDVQFRDGSSWWCDKHCSKASEPVHEPAIFNPATGMWSEKGSLAEMSHPRLYHGVTVLLPDCRVMVAGSDVTNDKTAELYSPPHLSRGPRPHIDHVPSTVTAGSEVTVSYHSSDPVVRAILIRNNAVTHSMAFDARALWLEITANTGAELTVAIPENRAVLIPGMYMLTILSDQGVPAEAKVVSIP